MGQNPTRPSELPARLDMTHGTPPENPASLFILGSVVPASWVIGIQIIPLMM
ncbi:MAG: hypothetical protein AAGE59_04620 [Cyanobacteria bacterium P01_F01_bin.86]